MTEFAPVWRALSRASCRFQVDGFDLLLFAQLGTMQPTVRAESDLRIDVQLSDDRDKTEFMESSSKSKKSACKPSLDASIYA